MKETSDLLEKLKAQGTKTFRTSVFGSDTGAGIADPGSLNKRENKHCPRQLH